MSWPNGRNLYKTARWQRRRAAQLRGEMFCRMCLEQNRYNDGSLRADGSPQRNPRRTSLIADHVEPHRHDETRDPEKGGAIIGRVDARDWPGRAA
ncbi:MAG: hypothetical protein AAGA32_17420 [Pseudomonadota bacterium]